ncbi:MAG TPA: hypothetical protein VNS58_15660 [Puia sp.]|nr:hypothetical protein [Puia sp.]
MITDINVLELIKFIIGALKDRKTKFHRWRPMLTLYEDLGEIISISYCFTDLENITVEGKERFIKATREIMELRPKEDLSEELARKIFGTPESKLVEEINKNFKRLDYLLSKLVDSLQNVYLALKIHNSELSHKITFHLKRKGSWFYFFKSNYSTGRLGEDGKNFTRKIVKIEKKLDLLKKYNKYDRDDFDKEFMAQFLLISQFDLFDRDSRARFMEEGKKNLLSLKEIHEELKNIIKDNCTIDDLLH